MTELFITCPEKIENLLVQELKELQIPGVRAGFRGVFAPQTLSTVYTVNYCSRLATRVLWPLVHFPCRDKEALYRAAKEIPWLDYLDETRTFAIDANVSHPHLRNSLYAAQLMKDGICDHIREKKGARPSVDVKHPDVQLHLFVHQQRGIISLDTSGSPLYKRGWRTLSSSASIQETLAAAVLVQAGYTPETILCDPFCGSGTFLIEAGLMATRTPPGFFRTKWGFMQMPQHNPEEWEAVKKQADAKRISLAPGLLCGADRDPESVRICKTHLKTAGFSDTISVQCSAIAHYRPPTSPALIISNPPYGKRLDASGDVYRQLGQFVRRTNAKVVVLAPHERLVREISLPVQSTFPFQHGGLPIAAYVLKLALS